MFLCRLDVELMLDSNHSTVGDDEKECLKRKENSTFN